MKDKMIENLKKNIKYHKGEKFGYDIFDVSICYFCGMFCIEIVGGWNYDECVPEFGFGTGFGHEGYYGGFDNALKVALQDIRNSNEHPKVKDAAESSLARACVEFHLKHKSML